VFTLYLNQIILSKLMVSLFIAKKSLSRSSQCPISHNISVSHNMFCWKNVQEMKHQVIHLCKGQAGFFLQILVSVMVLVEKNGFKRWSLLYVHICTTHLVVLLYFLMLTHHTYICPLHYALLPCYPPLKTCGCWCSSSSYQKPLVKIDAPFSNMAIIF